MKFRDSDITPEVVDEIKKLIVDEDIPGDEAVYLCERVSRLFGCELTLGEADRLLDEAWDEAAPI